jgi:hypothetical protein
LADSRVQRATSFDFVLDVKTTQSIGLTIPPKVAAQVTEWIEWCRSIAASS